MTQSERHIPTKMNITDVKLLVDSYKVKNVEVNALVIKEKSLNKEKQKEITTQEGLNKESQLNLKGTQEVTINSKKSSDDEAKDDNNVAKLSFFHKAKLKYDASLQVYLWLYNEIIALKEKMAELQREVDEEKMKRVQLENQVGNIPERLKAYEMEL